MTRRLVSGGRQRKGWSSIQDEEPEVFCCYFKYEPHNKGIWRQYYCNLRPWQISSEWIFAICCWISFNSRKNDLGRVWDNFSCTLLLSLPFLAPWGEVDIMFFTGDHRELFRLQVRTDINLDSWYSSENCWWVEVKLRKYSGLPRWVDIYL